MSVLFCHSLNWFYVLICSPGSWDINLESSKSRVKCNKMVCSLVGLYLSTVFSCLLTDVLCSQARSKIASTIKSGFKNLFCTRFVIFKQSYFLFQKCGLNTMMYFTNILFFLSVRKTCSNLQYQNRYCKRQNEFSYR